MSPAKCVHFSFVTNVEWTNSSLQNLFDRYFQEMFVLFFLDGEMYPGNVSSSWLVIFIKRNVSSLLLGLSYFSKEFLSPPSWFVILLQGMFVPSLLVYNFSPRNACSLLFSNQCSFWLVKFLQGMLVPSSSIYNISPMNTCSLLLALSYISKESFLLALSYFSNESFLLALSYFSNDCPLLLALSKSVPFL